MPPLSSLSLHVHTHPIRSVSLESSDEYVAVPCTYVLTNAGKARKNLSLQNAVETTRTVICGFGAHISY